MFLPQVDLVVDPRILLLPLNNERLHLLHRTRQVETQEIIFLGTDGTGRVVVAGVVRGVTLQGQIFNVYIEPNVSDLR